MVKQTKTEKKKMNPIVWFLFAIVIPIIVALILTIIIFAVAGVNVIDWAKEKGNNIPVLSSYITTPDEEEIEHEDEKIQATIADKDNEIEQLNLDLKNMEATIESLEQEIVKLENTNSKNSATVDEEQEENNTVKTISNSFKDMDNEQAALILQSLENDTAISILKELSNKVRGEILEAMDPQSAAELTQLFINSDN